MLTFPFFHPQVSELNRQGERKCLLDAVENCGSSGSQSGPVEVVVQRVYCIPITQSLHRASLQHKALDRHLSESAPPQHIGRYRTSVLFLWFNKCICLYKKTYVPVYTTVQKFGICGSLLLSMAAFI